MRKILRPAARIALVVALCAALGLLLLLAANALPQARITENVSRSAELFRQEGMYPQMRTFAGARKLDNYTDAWMLLHAAYDDPAHPSLLDRTLNVYSHLDGTNTVDTLIRVYGDRTPAQGTHTYARYWHGYLVYLRPLLTVMSYERIRTVLLLLQVLMTALVAFLFLYRRKAVQALSFLLCAAMLSPVCLANSLQFSSVYLILCLGMALILARKRWTMGQLTVLFTVIGCATNYVDFLTYPLATFGMPALALLCMQQEGRTRDQLKALLALLLCWGCGYAGMWAAKWLLGMLLGGMNLFTDVLGSVQLRASGVSEAGADIEFFYTLSYTFGQYWDTPLRFIALLLVFACLLHALRRRAMMPLLGRLATMLPVAALPVLWVALMRNHTFEHYWYVYRMFIVSVFALLCIAAPQESVIPAEPKKESEA